MRILCTLLLLASLAGAADNFVSHQGGTTITPRTWTLLPTSGWPAVANAYIAMRYSPACDCMLYQAQYHEDNEEINQGNLLFSYTEQRWSVFHDGNIVHEPSYQDTPGHIIGALTWMPLYSSFLVSSDGSGSNDAEHSGNLFWYDPIGQTMRNKYSGVDPNHYPFYPYGSGSKWGSLEWDSYHGVAVVASGSSPYMGIYDPATNLFSYPTITGTCPTFGPHSATYNSLDHRVWYTQLSGSTLQVFAFDAGSNTCSPITLNPDPTNGSPTARMWAGWAYDADDNIIMMTSGTDSGQATNYPDTWALHPGASNAATWELVSSSAPWATGQVTTGGFTSWWRFAYDTTHKVFIFLSYPTGTQTNQCTLANTTACGATYAISYVNAVNAGTVTPNSTGHVYVPTPGYLNQLYTGSGNLPSGCVSNCQVDEASASFASVAADGTGNLYVAWLESGKSYDPNADEGLRHPYVAKSTNGGSTWSYLAGAWNTLDSSATESGDLHLAVTSAGVPFIAYNNSPALSTHPALRVSSYAGSWSTVSVSPQTSGWDQGITAITTVGTTAYVATAESHPSYIAMPLYGYSCSGSSCTFLSGGGAAGISGNGAAGAMDHYSATCDSNGCSRVLEVSAASDGTNPYFCWNETIVNNNHTYIDVLTTPQIYCKYYNGLSWSGINGGNSLNANTSNWAQDVALTAIAGTAYVAWTERAAAGNPKLYVKSCTAGACTLIGNVINRDTTNGWPVHPSLTNDGTNVYLTWEESQNAAQRQRLYAASYNGSAWSYLGAALNADPVNGSTYYSSVAVANSKPVALWTEATPGNLRQVYAKFWNRSNWMPNGIACSISPSALGPWPQGQVVNVSLTASNCSPSTWAIASGALPGGLTLDALTGAITGTISTGGLFSPTITYDTASQPYTITVTGVASSGATLSGGRFSGGVIAH